MPPQHMQKETVITVEFKTSLFFLFIFGVCLSSEPLSANRQASLPNALQLPYAHPQRLQTTGFLLRYRCHPSYSSFQSCPSFQVDY
jgi:hypothetical protein